MQRVAGCARPKSAVVVAASPTSLLRATNVPLPSSIDYAPKLLPVRDQGSSDKCVAYALAAMKEFQDQPGVYLDVDDLYSRRASSKSDGMSLVNGLQILQQHGIAPHPDNHRIADFAAHYKDLNAVKSALVSKGVIVASFPFNANAKDARFWLNGQDDGVADGHCVAIVGYDDARGALKLRNSWGTSYGERGYAWISYADFVATVWESFSSTDQDGKSDPEALPKPSCCNLLG